MGFMLKMFETVYDKTSTAYWILHCLFFPSKGSSYRPADHFSNSSFWKDSPSLPRNMLWHHVPPPSPQPLPWATPFSPLEATNRCKSCKKTGRTETIPQILDIFEASPSRTALFFSTKTHFFFFVKRWERSEGMCFPFFVSLERNCEIFSLGFASLKCMLLCPHFFSLFNLLFRWNMQTFRKSFLLLFPTKYALPLYSVDVPCSFLFTVECSILFGTVLDVLSSAVQDAQSF